MKSKNPASKHIVVDRATYQRLTKLKAAVERGTSEALGREHNMTMGGVIERLLDLAEMHVSTETRAELIAALLVAVETAIAEITRRCATSSKQRKQAADVKLTCRISYPNDQARAIGDRSILELVIDGEAEAIASVTIPQAFEIPALLALRALPALTGGKATLGDPVFTPHADLSKLLEKSD